MKLLVNIFSGKVFLLLCVVTLFFNVVHAQGDNPCSAQALTVNTSCTYANYNYPSSSTGSTGIPAPGCANYPAGGDDVWFSAVVPASGILIVDMNTATGGPADMGMAFYSANSCAGPFALIECDDDDSNNGTMPYINRPGLTPGSTVYIRVWEYGADAYGAFRICASTSTTTACVGGQNNNCATADPFCTGTAYNYCNSTGVASGGAFNCLLTTPNPMWMYLNVQTSGSIDIQIQQFTNAGTGIDVDFALYGPYTGISAACSAITGATATVDCSYSIAYTEYANITSAVAGQWYMLLITNFNGAAGYIQFNQTGGTGTTNCNIVNPSCLITGVTATPSNCNGSNQYSVSGAISVSNPPSSGTLTVSSSCGGSQTFNAPFTSPINYSLAGLTPTGGSCTVTAAFSALSCSLTQNYTSPAIPTINGGVDQTVCANTAITLTASGGSTYSWTGGVSNGVSFTPSATTTYTVTGTNAQGCTATDPVLVTVNTLPTTNAGGDAAVCAGASTSLTASGATSYSWSPATGLSATTGATVTATPAATTTYTVTGTTGSCTSTDQVVVTVNPLPTINAGTDQTICIGSSASLTASGATTYSWSPSTSLSATSGATVTSSSASTITYTVTGSTGAGCTSTDEVIVNVNPIATANANIDQSVCAGGVITLAGSVGGASTTGVWSTTSGSFSNANSLSSTYTPSATSGTITLTLTSDDPSGPCPAVTDQMVVTINTSPIVNAGSDASFCVGGNTPLTASGADNYSWSPSTGLSASTGTSVTANPGSTTSYTVTGTSASGCTSTDLVVVTVNPIPTVNAGVDQTICQGPTVTLAASGASTYSWTGGITNGTSFSPVIGSTTYTVTGTSAAGCTNTDDVVVTVNAVPVIVANDVSVCATNTVYVTASGGATYSWSPPTNLSAASGSSVTFTPGTTTTYTVTGTSAAGCTSTDQATVSVLANAPINAGPDVSICIGAATTLTATGGVTYSWNSGLGAGNGFSVSPTSTTTYTVVGTDAADCQGTDLITITVNPLPIVNGGVDQTVCAGTSITLSGSGASTYSWNNGATNGTSFVPSATSTYTVTGTSAAGCTATDQVLVTVNPLPTVNAGADQTVCTGTSVTLTGSGASTYSWSGGISNGVSFIPTGTTTYTLTGTSAAGCSSTDQVTITVLGNALINAGTDVSICAGASSTLTASGGVSYTWNNGVGAGNGLSVTPAATTTYTVTGTDASGCTGTDAIMITVNPLPVVNGGVDQTVCAGTSVTLSGLGASTYSWDNGATNGASFIPASTNTYTVTGTTAAGCTGTDQVLVTVNPLPTVNAGADQTVCIGTSVTLTGSGASTYSWSGGISNGVSFIPSGTAIYTLTGTSAAGCSSTDQVTVTVLGNALINAGTDVSICAGASSTLTASGGVSYTWNNGVGAGNGMSVTPAATTNYTVTGTDASGCTGTDAIMITVNPLPVVNGGVDQTVCAGTNVSLSGTGASTYSWDNGATNGASFIPASTNTYTVTGTTAAGCTGTDQVLVTVNPLPIVNAGTDQTVCAGSSVTLSGSGASTYSWSGGISNGVAFTPSATATYTLTGTSAAGCTSTDQVIVNVNPLPIVNAGTDQNVCDGASVTLIATGAATYSWTGGVANGVSFVPSLGTTNYTVTGTSAASCTATDQIAVTVNPNPDPVIQGPTAYCVGNFAVLSTSQTFSSYSWSTGATTSTINATTANNPISVTVTNSFGCSALSSNFIVSENSVITANFTETICQGGSVVIHGISETVAGVYSQTFTSATGCDSVSNVTLVVNPLPAVNAGADLAVCTGTQTTLSGSGAVNYSWNNSIINNTSFTQAVGSITYTVTGTDANGCVNSDQVVVLVNPLPLINAGTDQIVCIGQSVILAGSGGSTYLWNNSVSDGVSFNPTLTNTYTVTGTDVNGCIGSDQVLVTVNTLPTVNAGGDQAICAGETVTLSGSGANTYSWDNSVSNNVSFSPSATATYTVTGTDGNGCINTDQVQVTVNTLPVVFAGPDQAVCINSPVTVSGSGASIYTWNNNALDGVSFIISTTTTYTVTGTDVNGCTNTDLMTINVNGLPLINAGPDQTICIGSGVTLSGSGALNYVWNNSVTDGVSFNPTLTNTYTVTGTDVNGCVSSDQVLVTVNTLPIVNAGGDQAICAGETVILSGSGANTYSWDNSVSNNVSFSPSATTTYTVTGTDGNGCINTDQVQVTVNTLPVVLAGPDQAVCINSPVTVSGSGASIYTWNNNALDGVSFIISTTTTYTVTGTDVNGCTNTDLMTINVNGLPLINAGPDQTICIGSGVTLSGSGALNYVWNNSVTDGVSFNPTLTNTYTVTGTDVNGCVSSDQVLVTVNTLPTVNAGVDQVICVGETVTLSGSGANTYTWDNTVSNNVPFSPNSSTTYTVTGTDANGCVNTDQIQVTVNLLPTVNAGNDQTVCLGANVTLSGTGAVAYSWDNGVQNSIAFSPSSGTVIYTVTGTSNFGCTNTDQVSVTVNPLPAVVAGLDDAVCIGESATLSGSGASTYTWDNGVVDGVAFSPSSTLTYTVIGTSTEGCTSSDQVIITVNPLPTVFAGNDLSVCEGVAVTLTGSGAATYSWDNGVTNGTVFNSPVGTSTYTVTGTSVAGCVNIDQVNVTVNTAPLVVFDADTTIGCLPLLVNFTNTTPGSSNCIWTLSDGTVLLGCGSVSNLFDQAGCYDVTLTVTDDNGCSNSSSSVDYICVEAPPIASFTPSATELPSFATEVTFLNSSYGASSYNWTFGNSSYSVEENPVYVFPEDEGSYVVTLVASSPLGCTDVATATINVKEELVFYVPNTFTPDNDDYNEVFKPVFYSGFDPYDFSLLIFNRWGEIVFESRNAEVGWDGSYGSNNEIEMVQDGTYTWVIRYRITETKGYRKATGHVNLIR